MKREFTYMTTFSGCGGSALGLRQAGGEGFFALDWDPEPKWKRQIAYEHLVLNFPELHRKGCILNEDIHNVSGQQILKITGIKEGELVIYQSSPPCQAISKANSKRNANDPKNLLFFEAIGHVWEIQPKVCVLENVANLVGAQMNGLFYNIVEELENAGYNVKSWVLEASSFGAPQTRPRTWIIGIREDLLKQPTVPLPAKKILGVSDVLPDLIGHQQGSWNKRNVPGWKPCTTITRTQGLMVIDKYNNTRLPTENELRVLSTFPDDYQFNATLPQIHAMLGNAVLPLQMRVIAEHLIKTAL